MIDRCTMEFAQSISARFENAPTLRMGVDCNQKLDVGFFFDGMGRHLESDAQNGRVGNIGKLYEAYPLESESSNIKLRKYYYSGLGTPFDASISENVAGAAHRVPSEAETTRDGQLRDSAIDAAKDVASGNQRGRWWEVFGRSFKGSITRPWNWVKQARDSVVRTGAEAFAPIRDNTIVASVLMSGSHTRQSAAIRDFQQSVSDVKQASQMPLAQIRVSVFGFDFGAAMAKAFVRELLDDVCEKEGSSYLYAGAEVKVIFVGLLDCVDRTHPEMGPLDWFHPLTPVLDDGGPLHPGCQRALHLIAAHERRYYRRCRPLGGRNPQWREELCPGISDDIGGGLVADEQKVSAELSRAALHRMYRQAMSSGVPYPPLERLRERDAMTAQLFELNDRIEGYSLLALARHYQRETASHSRPTVDGFRFHTLTYLAWLAQRYRNYSETLAILENREDALPNRYYNRTIGAVAASVMGSRERWQLEEAERGEIDAAREELKQSWGWLEQVDSEAAYIRRRFSSPDGNTRRHARAVLGENRILAESWYQWTREVSPPALPEPIDLLFSYGLHDKQPEEMNYRNHQPSQITGGYRFMTYRGIDHPGEESAAQATEPHPRERLSGWAMR
ncbi:DUF2235 domain-containing protein [Halomonas desiderata]|uniref:DUF2235 domain-containing protein n=1 Tax=Billgrantia desiderata TaxID=52021 RepID=A0ABS9AZ40_9GAMM|nr:DUF2235 domain-containing protein [Halomonas desiderata]MCE8040646.1 DUF2235 domain-containing protein [Halomonas desiderata]MCE8045221.1 DUF2235 domain-containing protein [Halomonas desiderata]NIC38591.1 DUF2235 domain-containing protein [Halomonas desiderata]